MAAVRVIDCDVQALQLGDMNYFSLAAASNGRLYGAPCDASRVLEIDPAAGETRLIGDELPGRGSTMERSGMGCSS